MFKKFHKYMAFTLAELLIVFSIIAVISGITFMSTKRLQTTDKYAYQRAYDTLATAAYNALTENPNINSPGALCEGLTRFINSQAATDTGTDSDEVVHAAFNGNPDAGYCNSIANRATIETENFDNDAARRIVPDFVANNGMRFYITRQITQGNICDSLSAPCDASDLRSINFYIIFVDLDGASGQNSIASGDIVAFAITGNADVIPLGLHAYNTRNLGVRVVFPESSHRADETFSQTMSYREAMRTAWGGLTNFDELKTFDFNEFEVLQNAKFLNNSDITNARNAANNIQPDHRCICDFEATPGVADNECWREGNALHPTMDERFECDIRIQRYY